MVYYFKTSSKNSKANSSGTSSTEDVVIYMGKDKFENEHLIKHSNSQNIWFHVDNISSAHVYLQLSESELIENKKFNEILIDDELLHKIGQLTKANSIKGNKLNNVTIIYTVVENLLSDGSMDVGTVTFKNPRLVKKVFIDKRNNQIVNELNKSKTEVTTEEFIEKQTKMKNQVSKYKTQQQKKLDEISKHKQMELNQRKDPYKDLFSDHTTGFSNNEFREENWVEDDFW